MAKKRLSTHRADVGLLSYVDSTVSVQVTGDGEGLVTGGEDEKLAPCVCSLVTL